MSEKALLDGKYDALVLRPGMVLPGDDPMRRSFEAAEHDPLEVLWVAHGLLPDKYLYPPLRAVRH